MPGSSLERNKTKSVQKRPKRPKLPKPDGKSCQSGRTLRDTPVKRPKMRATSTPFCRCSIGLLQECLSFAYFELLVTCGMSRVCPCARSFKESSPCLGRTRSLFHVVSCISEEAHALNMKLDLSGDGGASYVILIYIYIYRFILFSGFVLFLRRRLRSVHEFGLLIVNKSRTASCRMEAWRKPTGVCSIHRSLLLCAIHGSCFGQDRAPGAICRQSLDMVSKTSIPVRLCSLLICVTKA